MRRPVQPSLDFREAAPFASASASQMLQLPRGARSHRTRIRRVSEIPSSPALPFMVAEPGSRRREG